MEKIHQKIWNLAKPYYEKGRPMDIAHITWMLQAAQLVCKKEKIDTDIFIPLVILHDIGYCNVPKNNPFNLNLRKAHMKKGQKIALTILKHVNYPKETVHRIVHYVSIHDNWAFGKYEFFTKDKLFGTFSDLDFIWMATPNGFTAVRKILRKTPKEMIIYLEKDKKHASMPFSTKTTKILYEKYLNAKRKELIK